MTELLRSLNNHDDQHVSNMTIIPNTISTTQPIQQPDPLSRQELYQRALNSQEMYNQLILAQQNLYLHHSQQQQYLHNQLQIVEQILKNPNSNSNEHQMAAMNQRNIQQQSLILQQSFQEQINSNTIILQQHQYNIVQAVNSVNAEELNNLNKK